MKKILRQAGIGPAGERAGISWRAFLRAQAQSMLAVDFFTVETISLQRLHVLIPTAAHASKLRVISPPSAGVERRDRLGGLIHEYRHAA